MAHSHTVGAKTVAAVERARKEVNSFKAQVTQLVRSQTPAEQEMGRNLAQRVIRAESIVMKADATVKRMRQVSHVPPRPTASAPPASRAKRALSVLLTGFNSGDGPQPRDGNAKEKAAEPPGAATRNVRQKTTSAQPIFLSAAGKPTATPIREDGLAATLQRAIRETDLKLGRISSNGIWFECRNVFRAFMWFKAADPPTDKPAAGDTAKHSYIVPEHIGFFGTDETNASRWSRSRHAVFNVVTERANAAIRYFMAREATGEDAFIALAKWLARHKTLFTAKCDDRRLAFDASRGFFLPCCIYPFEGDASPRFTRGSIPVRSTSSYAAQPTVRMPSGSTAPNGQPQSMPAVNGTPLAVGHNAAVGQSVGGAMPMAGREGLVVPKQQPVPVAASGARGGAPDARSAQNRQRP